MRSGSPQDIAARVKELMRAAAPDGGFALGAGNLVPNWASYESYLPMRGTCLKHGTYPISIR